VLAVLENADLSAAAVQSKGEYEQAEAGYVTSTASSLPQQIQKAELDASSSKAAQDAQEKIYDSRKDLFAQAQFPAALDAGSGAGETRGHTVSAKALDDLRRIGKDQALKTAGGQLRRKGKLLGAEAAQFADPQSIQTWAPTVLYPGELAPPIVLLTVMNTSHLIAKAHVSQAKRPS
jgi:hypothetical protein